MKTIIGRFAAWSGAVVVLVAVLLVAGLMTAARIRQPGGEPADIVMTDSAGVERMQMPKTFSLVSPDGRTVMDAETVEDIRGRSYVHFAVFRDLESGAVTSYPVDSSVIGRGGPGLLPSYDESIGAFSLAPLGWSRDGVFALYVVRDDLYSARYERNYHWRIERLGRGILRVDRRTGAVSSPFPIEVGPVSGVFDFLPTSQTLVTERSVTGSGSLPTKVLEVRKMSDDGIVSDTISASIWLRIAGSFVSSAVLSDGGKYLGYVVALPKKLDQYGLADAYLYEAHLYDLETGVDFPLARMGGESASVTQALEGDYAEINHWYYDSVMRSSVEKNGEVIDLRLEPGKIKNNLALPIAGYECSGSGIFCLESKLKGKTIDNGQGLMVLATAGGYFLQVEVKDIGGNVVANGVVTVDPYFGSFGKPTEFDLTGGLFEALRYTAVPTSAEGTLEVTATSYREGEGQRTLEKMTIPVRLPKIEVGDLYVPEAG